MRWSTKQRLEFIETRLYWEGKISRKDLTDFFDISIPQATKDIKEYISIASENIQYDPKAKLYVAAQKFNAKITTPSSEQYLNLLEFSRVNNNKFFNGNPPPFSVIPVLKRFVDIETLKFLLRAIRDSKAVKICYQSLTAPKPKDRWITPHAFGYDGFRWHVRALCHNTKIYKDFNLGRILSINNSKTHVFDHSIDYEWHNEINIIIEPNPSLADDFKSLIERDYCMEGGQLTISVKAAFYYYYKKIGVSAGYNDSQPDGQQIIIKNLPEAEAKISLLRSMTENKIKNLPDFSIID